MPKAVAQPVREEIVAQQQAGTPLTQIAAALSMPYRTVRGIVRRFRTRGREGLAADYQRCAQAGPRFASAVYKAALQLRREHPRWGAMMIRVQLAGLFPQESLPQRRTLQEWLQRAGLSPGRSRAPSTHHARGKEAHEVWQLDAKEELRLADGSESCSFSVVDEATGAVLGALWAVALFSPREELCGTGGGGAGVADASADGLGQAQAVAGG